MQFTLTPGQLTYADLSTLLDPKTTLVLDESCKKKVEKSQAFVTHILEQKQVVYGINTGFGALAQTQIPLKDLTTLQHNLILSHAAGTGSYLDDSIVRLILILKINSLARGYSGIRLETLSALITLFNQAIYPCIPAQGSVGASGDLAPLAHLSAVLLEEGEARHKGKIISAKKALALAKLSPLKLAPKEGLALLNGTQVSTAIALSALLKTESVFHTALQAGALSTDAVKGTDVPFDARIQEISGHPGQIRVAKILRELLKGSGIRASHEDCGKVQDPYSLRCQPQVMGACLTQMEYVRTRLVEAANAVSDNPLIFAEDKVVLSGGNFHAESIALTSDALATCIAEIGALSERRIALLIDPIFSGLPAFLTPNAGLNSGFMIAQVTAAALASENKSLAHPASVDSLPTSANQEDHVSMATFAARRLHTMVENTATIVAIELLAAAQGIDFRHPDKTSPTLQKLHQAIRKLVPFYKTDRFFAPDMEKIKGLVLHSTFIPEFLGNAMF